MHQLADYHAGRTAQDAAAFDEQAADVRAARVLRARHVLQPFVEAREPQLFVQQIPIKSNFWVYTELSRFPLSDDGKTVTNILSAELAFGDTREVLKYFSGTE